ncbi:hypothetical protein ACPPVT_18420 [Angustibacter sp. McL0619]|uniref:hypothetical protein n=1 Tax=Angustibacter sp. McL0619 TaxID=3415676 RepID=UPI003CED65DE
MSRWTRRGPGVARRRPLLPGLVGLFAVAVTMSTAGCGSSSDSAPQALTTATVPADEASAPAGWQTRQGPGFSVALPPQWQNRPDDQRAAPSAALEVGVPYAAQTVPPPLLLAFVGRDLVGPLPIREKVLRAQLEAGLPDDTTLGASTHVKVAGSTDAVTFDVTYRTKGGTSVTGVRLAPTTVRQRELIVETAGLPKYGFRYAAAQDDFDQGTWNQILGSIVVRAGDQGTEAPSTDGQDS